MRLTVNRASDFRRKAEKGLWVLQDEERADIRWPSRETLFRAWKHTFPSAGQRHAELYSIGSRKLVVRAPIGTETWEIMRFARAIHRSMLQAADKPIPHLHMVWMRNASRKSPLSSQWRVLAANDADNVLYPSEKHLLALLREAFGEDANPLHARKGFGNTGKPNALILTLPRGTTPLEREKLLYTIELAASVATQEI